MSSAGGVSLGNGLKRVDVVALRKKIATSLGQEKIRRYWDLLIRFTQFKLSKQELDTNARLVPAPCCLPPIIQVKRHAVSLMLTAIFG
jgi:hypothetical protein